VLGLAVTSLVTSQHERRADLQESGIWILTSCAPGKRLPQSLSKPVTCANSITLGSIAKGYPGRRNQWELAIRLLIMPLSWGNKRSWS